MKEQNVQKSIWKKYRNKTDLCLHKYYVNPTISINQFVDYLSHEIVRGTIPVKCNPISSLNKCMIHYKAERGDRLAHRKRVTAEEHVPKSGEKVPHLRFSKLRRTKCSHFTCLIRLTSE